MDMRGIRALGAARELRGPEGAEGRLVRHARTVLTPRIAEIRDRLVRDGLYRRFENVADTFLRDGMSLQRFQETCDDIHEKAGALRTPLGFEPARSLTLRERLGKALGVGVSVGIVVWLGALLLGTYGTPGNWTGHLVKPPYVAPAVTLHPETLPNADCAYRVSLRDADGREGGKKVPVVATVCP